MFWIGIFSAKVARQSEDRSLTWVFAPRCLASSMIFLTIVAGFGNLVHTFLSIDIIRFLNGGIGSDHIMYAFRKIRALKLR